MRTRGSWALKSKHFQGPYSLVSRIACPLLEASFVITAAEHKQTCPPHALSSLLLLQHVSTAPVQVAVNWLFGLDYCQPGPKRTWICPDLSLNHHYTVARTSVEAQGWWEGGVKGCQGWIAGDGLQRCMCADIGSEAVQLCKKSPLSLDTLHHHTLQQIYSLDETSLVTLGLYFQSHPLALTMCIHLGPLHHH